MIQFSPVKARYPQLQRRQVSQVHIEFAARRAALPTALDDGVRQFKRSRLNRVP
jgi:hypothetical protein